MPSKVEAGNDTGEGSDEQNKLLKDVVTLRQVLNLDKHFSRNSSSPAKSWSKSTKKVTLSDPKSKPEASKEENSRKEKKSIWNWKPLKALSISRNRRFNCSFSLQVHLIECLPSSFNDASICVCWKRRDDILVTPPAKVIQGVAEFEHMLTYTSSIYGSKSVSHNSAKYEAKHSLLYASVVNAPELDLGKHRVDLSRLLPLTLEELLEEKSTGKWTTSFRLSGTAKGAVMNVSFGYVVVGDKGGATADNHGVANVLSLRQNSTASMKLNRNPSRSDGGLIRTGSLPSFTNEYSSQNVDEVKDLHEVLPLMKSISSGDIFKKYNEEKTHSHSHNMPELDVLKENLEPIKSDVYSSSDIGKDKPEEHPVNKGKTSTPVHGKPEFCVFQENLEKVKPDGYPLPDSGKENAEEDEGNGFPVVDKGIEFSSNENVKLEESAVKALVSDHAVDSIEDDTQDEVNDSSKEKAVVHEISYKEDDICTKEVLLQEIESALKSVSELEALALESPNIMEVKSEYKLRKSYSLDDATDLVASEFLNMLGIEHSPMDLSFESEPESPRERLLRQFEMDTKSEGFSLFDSDMGSDNEAHGGSETTFGSEPWNLSEGVKSSSFLENLHERHPIQFQDMWSKEKAQMLEDLETEALMREWGLDENMFQHSPPRETSGFGSPIHVLPEDEESIILPPLAEGLGPFIPTKDGGFLRSMNPLLFRNAKSGGNLIMQISNSVVVPAEMGSGIMQILQCLASMGIEKLSMQAKKLMPLEDIAGKTMQQIAWEAKPVQGKERQCHLIHNLVTQPDTTCVLRALKGTPSLKFSSSSVGNQTGSEFVSLETLAPLAMDKIEALSMEGLRIQSGLSEEDAPSNIVVQPFGDTSALHGKGINISGSLALDRAAALKLLDIKDRGGAVDGITGLSLTLDEWLRLDSCEIDDIDNISEHTSKFLAALHANSFDLTCGCSKGEKKQCKDPGRKPGLLGNNFTVALMVLLHDPLRNYEPVGRPMLALIQVERVFAPPKQKLYRRLSEVGNMNDNKDDDDDECEIVAKVEMKEKRKEEKGSEEEGITQFRITEVHVAGLKTEPHKKKLWDSSSRHHQSASRWLLANGMGKSKKNPLMKSKVASRYSAPVTTKVQPGDTLWSISSRIYGTGDKWMELAALNSHIRNPNIIIPNETIRTR